MKKAKFEPTVLYGFKGSAIIACLLFLIAIISLFIDKPDHFLFSLIAFCGWMGWAIQEFEHENDLKN